MNDYARAPNQPLLTTSSPTFAGLTINGAATFASTVTATGQFLAGAGSAAAPAYSFTAYPGVGLNNLNQYGVGFTYSGSYQFSLDARITHGFQLASTLPLGWNAGANPNNAPDVAFFRLAAASLRLGLSPSATPIAQTFTIGEASRPGTDTNVGGANGTIRSGLGTGTGTASSVIIKGVVLAASGSTVQTYQSMVEVKGVALGFYNATPVAQQTGVAVSAAGIHAALVNLGLITA